MNTNNITEIYIQLLDEGTPTARSTQAVDLGNGCYEVLPTPQYDPEDEKWEFPPGSIVRCKMTAFRSGEHLMAVEKV